MSDENERSVASDGSMAHRKACAAVEYFAEWSQSFESMKHVVALRNYLNAGDWIPVTERLPEDGVDVLVSSPCPNSDTPNIGIASWGSESAQEPVWREADCGRLWPTHWMPLPAPPTDAK